MSDSSKDNGLYMILGEMRGDLKSIVGSLSTIRNDHLQLKEDVEKLETVHNDRLTKLEQFKWQIAGICVILPFGVTAIGWYLRSIT